MSATKTKPTKKTKAKLSKKIRIGLLLDESGSMSGNEQAVIDGTNEFVGSLKGEKNSDSARVSLAMFDERPGEPRCRVKADDVKLDKFDKLVPGDYQPQGMTPLNDAIVETIRRMEAGMKKDDKAMLVIFTDGLENASETTTEAVKQMIADKEKDGFTFIYLGANVDAQAEGSALGISRKTLHNFTSSPRGTEIALDSASVMASSYLSTGGKLDVDAHAQKYGSEIPEDDPTPAPTRSAKSSTSKARGVLRGD